MKKVIITASAHAILESSLLLAGYHVVNVPSITYHELLQIVGDADGLVVTTRLKIDKQMIDAAKQLHWIGRLGSGLELIDTDYATSKNISCISSPEGNRTAVGEHALGMLLTLFRNITKSSLEVREKQWLRNENRGIEITGKTVGIIGFGNTGGAFARVLSGFNCKVLAFDKYKLNIQSEYATQATLDDICKEADIISFHLPLTEETRYFADDAFFEALQKKPVIINTSRGGILSMNALLKALKNQSVSYAALDVLENENITALSQSEAATFNALANHPKVLLTPHIAGYTHESFFKMSKMLLLKLGIPAN